VGLIIFIVTLSQWITASEVIGLIGFLVVIVFAISRIFDWGLVHKKEEIQKVLLAVSDKLPHIDPALVLHKVSENLPRIAPSSVLNSVTERLPSFGSSIRSAKSVISSMTKGAGIGRDSQRVSEISLSVEDVSLEENRPTPSVPKGTTVEMGVDEETAAQALKSNSSSMASLPRKSEILSNVEEMPSVPEDTAVEMGVNEEPTTQASKSATYSMPSISLKFENLSTREKAAGRSSGESVSEGKVSGGECDVACSLQEI
jgi:hypothetical protein